MRAREYHLKSRPRGMPDAGTFELAERELPAPGEGEALVRNLWLSVDPYMRSRMNEGPSYVPAFKLGEPMEGGAVGEVVESRDPALKPGTPVFHMLGWRDAAVAPAAAFRLLPALPGVGPQAFLGVLGLTGMTAWIGLELVGRLHADDVVFVSGAAGAVGSAACQLAKVKGATVIGSAGSDAKVAWLKDVGVDAAFNYKTAPVIEQLRGAAPRGITLYFDNVGGDHLEAAMIAARPFARLVECGMIDIYNDMSRPGPRAMPMVVGKRLRIEGFIYSDHLDETERFVREFGPLVAGGRVRSEETVVHGLDKAPEAFLGLFRGDNLGKMLVKL